MKKLIVLLSTALVLVAQSNPPILPPSPTGAPIVCSIYIAQNNVLIGNKISQTSLELSWHSLGETPVARLKIDVSTNRLSFRELIDVPLYDYSHNRTYYHCVGVGGLTENTIYYFRVREIDFNGLFHSYPISEFKTLQSSPAAPSELRFRVIEQKSVVLEWNDNSNNEDGFIVERSINNQNNYQQIIITAPNSTSLADYGLYPNAFYYYRVKSFNSRGESKYSKLKLATLPDNVSVGKGLF